MDILWLIIIITVAVFGLLIAFLLYRAGRQPGAHAPHWLQRMQQTAAQAGDGRWRSIIAIIAAVVAAFMLWNMHLVESVRAIDPWMFFWALILLGAGIAVATGSSELEKKSGKALKLIAALALLFLTWEAIVRWTSGPTHLVLQDAFKHEIEEIQGADEAEAYYRSIVCTDFRDDALLKWLEESPQSVVVREAIHQEADALYKVKCIEPEATA